MGRMGIGSFGPAMPMSRHRVRNSCTLLGNLSPEQSADISSVKLMVLSPFDMASSRSVRNVGLQFSQPAYGVDCYRLELMGSFSVGRWWGDFWRNQFRRVRIGPTARNLAEALQARKFIGIGEDGPTIGGSDFSRGNPTQ
jgi:hypothetical protein